MNSRDEIEIDASELFQKSTERNRCRIIGSNGIVLLSIPIVGGRAVRSRSKDVRISYEEPWQQRHWRSMCAAYGKSSFFRFYAHRFQPFYERRFEYLIDFNTQLLQECFEMLQWKKKITVNETEAGNGYHHSAMQKHEASGAASYHQVFEERHGFISDLSIVDLIFNVGYEADAFLR